MRPSRIRRTAFLGAVLLAGTSGLVLGRGYEGYSYFRAIEGDARLEAADGDRAEAEVNYPIVIGDQLWVAVGGRADLLLADGSHLAVGSDTQVTFDSIAASPDAERDETQLRLFAGHLLFDANGAWGDGGGQTAYVDTANARVYLQGDGVALIATDGAELTEVTVRRGFVEVVDQRGSSVVRAGESVEIRGVDSPRATVLPAAPESTLEAWAADQEALHPQASDRYLDEPLPATASLTDHGDWLEVEGKRVWRPRVVTAGWRPYYLGRWTTTPSGLYWVSYDAWDPVVYHYGFWDYNDLYGWLWYPGYTFAPAHVYWYWGSSYAGWVPTGYYRRYTRSYYPGFGLRFGIYGWAGGSFDWFSDWTFCPVGYIGHRRPYHYYRYGRDFRGHAPLDRGILTTDTRRIRPENWHRPEGIRETLERGWRDDHAGGGDLPDVNSFVRRQRDLPQEVTRQVLLKPNPGTRTFDAPSLDQPQLSSGRGVDLRSNRSRGIDREDSAGRQTLSQGRQVGSVAGTPNRGSRSVAGSPTPDTGALDAVSGVRRQPAVDPGSGRQTVSRPSGDSADRRSVVRSEPARVPVANGDSRTAVPRDRSFEPDNPARREPAQRVLDGIRGRTPVTPRTTAAPSSGSSGSGRATVSRTPVSGSSPRSTVSRPPSSQGAARTPVSGSRGSSARSNESRQPSRGPAATTGGSRTVEPRSSSPRSSYRPPPQPSSSRSTVRQSTGGSQTGSSSRTIQRSTPPPRSTASSPSRAPGSSTSSRSSGSSTSSRRATVSRPPAGGSGRASSARSGSSRAVQSSHPVASSPRSSAASSRPSSTSSSRATSRSSARSSARSGSSQSSRQGSRGHGHSRPPG